MGPKVDIYQDRQREWRWRATAGNSRIVAESGEGYKSREDCINGLKIAMRTLATVTLQATID